MLSLIPAFTLIFTAILLQVIGRWVLTTGRTWLFASIISIVAWLSMIVIRIIMPAGLTVYNWLPGNTGVETVIFQFSSETWILGFLLVSLLVAVVFVEAKNLEQGNYINVLSGSMALTAFGLLAILSNSGITFLLTWVMIDLFEYGVLAWIIKDRKTHNTSIFALIVRISGVILMLFIVAMQDPITLKVGAENGKAITGLLVLLVAVLRSGIIPIHLPYTADVTLRRGISSILRFIPPLSVMAFLLNIGVQEFSARQIQFLSFILVLGVFYGAISWFFSRNELNGSPYWIISIISLVLLSFIRQSLDSITGLAIIMVSCGSAIFIYSPRFKTINAYFPLLLLGMVALPYTPTKGIEQVFGGENFKFINLLLILILAILLGGVIRHSLSREDSTDRIEAWMYFFYVAALIILLISPWINTIFDLSGATGGNHWWISIVLILSLASIFAIDLLRRKRILNFAIPFTVIKRRIGPIILNIDKFLQFSWLSRFARTIGSIISSAIIIFVRVLEGDGGILWSFLFLVLLASIIVTRMVP